jgi:hypothetical protein
MFGVSLFGQKNDLKSLRKRNIEGTTNTTTITITITTIPITTTTTNAVTITIRITLNISNNAYTTK